MKCKVIDIEQIHNEAIRFIANLRGRDESMSAAREGLKLETLKDRKKNHRLCLHTRIIQTEEQQHDDTLLIDYEEATRNIQPESMTTRAPTRRNPKSI